MKEVTPIFDGITSKNSSVVYADLHIGETYWSIKIYPNETESSVYIGYDDLEQLKKIYAAIDVKINEHEHDQILIDALNEEIRINEVVKVENRKKEEALRTIRIQELKEEVKCFSPLTVRICSINNIEVGDGTSTVSICRDEWSSYKGWTLDNRTYDYSYKRSYKSGVKKSSMKLSKLVDFTKEILSSKTYIAKCNESKIQATQSNDEEMIKNGWSFGGGRVYNSKTFKSEPTSDCGKTYTKDGVTVEVERVQNTIIVKKVIIKDLNIPLDQFIHKKYK